MKKASASEIKNKMIRNLTKNQYEEQFYETMLDNYSQFELEDCILELIVIFGN